MKRRGTCGMKTSISKKNPYWLPKHRFLELYHFSLQYNEFKKEIADTVYLPDDPGFDPTGEVAVKLERLHRNVELIESCCKDSDRGIWRFLLLGVTEGYSYETLRSRFHIPCGKDYYFIRWRKVYWLMSGRK